MFQNSLEKIFGVQMISDLTQRGKMLRNISQCMRMTDYTNANIFPWVDHIVPTLVMLLKKTCQYKVTKIQMRLMQFAYSSNNNMGFKSVQ